MNPRQRRLRRLRRKDRKDAHEAEIYRRFAAERSRAAQKKKTPGVLVVQPSAGSLLSTMLQGKPIP